MRVQHLALTLPTRYRTKFRGFLGEGSWYCVSMGKERAGESQSVNIKRRCRVHTAAIASTLSLHEAV